MDTTELELEILELEEKMKATRNPVAKSDAESKIAILKKKIKEAKNTSDKYAILQKDVPVRVDHVDDSVSGGRQITNTGDVFTSIL